MPKKKPKVVRLDSVEELKRTCCLAYRFAVDTVEANATRRPKKFKSRMTCSEGRELGERLAWVWHNSTESERRL